MWSCPFFLSVMTLTDHNQYVEYHQISKHGYGIESLYVVVAMQYHTNVRHLLVEELSSFSLWNWRFSNFNFLTFALTVDGTCYGLSQGNIAIATVITSCDGFPAVSGMLTNIKSPRSTIIMEVMPIPDSTLGTLWAK